MQAGDETEMICPRCNRDAVETVNVRGETGCLHCQLDRIWDYVEGTRRMIPTLLERLHAVQQTEEENIRMPIAKFLGDDK